MATLILRLETDPVTKKKNVLVKYDSDSDALPNEHEEQHKKIVEALLAGGKVQAEDIGTITIERESHAPQDTPATQAQPPLREPIGNKK